MSGRTKEERFLIHLYEYVKRSGDPDHLVNRYDLGKTIGFSPKGVDTMCKMLMRTNFIKRFGDTDIQLTEHGAKLAESLLRGLS